MHQLSIRNMVTSFVFGAYFSMRRRFMKMVLFKNFGFALYLNFTFIKTGVPSRFPFVKLTSLATWNP